MSVVHVPPPLPLFVFGAGPIPLPGAEIGVGVCGCVVSPIRNFYYFRFLMGRDAGRACSAGVVGYDIKH